MLTQEQLFPVGTTTARRSLLQNYIARGAECIPPEKLKIITYEEWLEMP